MKLLIMTQAVDRADPILGFFHRWIEEFSKHTRRLTVIGQRVGNVDLPKNVTVLSLGKDEGDMRPFQVTRFLWLLWNLRGSYDALFVHMTPIWAVLAWPVTTLLRKRVYLWYEARGARWPLRLSLFIVRKIFSASTHGMPIGSRKNVIVGHGIDVEAFAPSPTARDPHQLLAVGRVTASKRLHILLDTLATLPESYHLLVAGNAITAHDRRLHDELMHSIKQLHLHGRVEMHPIPQREIVHAFQHAALFMHASRTSLDKALLEAMACGCLVVSCAPAAHAVLPPECLATEEGMATHVKTLLNLRPDEQERLRHRLRETVVRHHSLPRLVLRLLQEMK